MFLLGLSRDADKAQLESALIAMRAAVIEASDIDLVGCQAFLLPGGLALGDLARASQASDVPAVRAADGVAGIAAREPGQ